MPKKTSAASPKKSKEVKSPAKSLRDYSLAANLPTRLKPEGPRRASKPPTRFTQGVQEKKEAKPIVIPKGKGKKLKDCPNVAAQINKRNKSDELLRIIHGLVLGRVVKGVDVRENLLNFNGVDMQHKDLEAKVNRMMLRPIREILAFFGQDPEGEREDVVSRLADFLMKPAPSDEKYSTKKRKSSSSRSRSSSPARSKSSSRSKSPAKKRTKKDPNAPKRALSSYMFFCQDKREALQKKYPDDKVTDIAKKLGAKWKKVSASDKKKYEAQAEKDKARYEKEMAKYEKKQKKEKN